MERNREGRRWSIASANGIGMSKRRYRIAFLRDSTEGERQVELQEMVRLRDRGERVQKKNSGQMKGRRLERYAQRDKDKDVDGRGGGGGSGAGDSSAEESFDEDFEEYDAGKALLSTSKVNTIAVASTVRSSPVLRVADELIGVPVPRRARSASVKRSHEYWNSSNGGFGEEQSSRGFSPSPLSRSSNGVSTSYSSLPTRKKMKQLASKTQIPKVTAEPSSSVQDDIEIEVVEALFDLMKQSQSLSQSQSSKKFERSSDNNSTAKFDSICNKAVDDNSTCSPIISAKIVHQTSDLPQEFSLPSSPLLDVDTGSKKKGEEDGKDETVEISACNVSSNEIKAHNELSIKMRSDNSLSKLEKKLSINIASDAWEHKGEDNVGRGKDPKDQAGESVGGGELVIRQQVVAPKEEESRLCAKSNAEASTNSSVSKANQKADLVENKREAKFEIDLMVPLLIPSSPERERDGLTEIGSVHKFVSPDVRMKSKTVAKDEFLVSGKGHEEKQMQTNCIKQEFTRLDFEKPHKDNFSITQCGQNQQRQCKVPLSEGQHFAQTNLLPFPIAVTGWPGGYYPGYMAPFQMITPLDGSAKPSAQLQPLPFSLSKPRPKRCATHQHIARSICYHQQLTKNYTWPAAFGPASLDPTSSVSNSIPGNSLQGDLLAGQVLACKSSEIPNNMDATKTKQPVIQQASQQTQPGNLVQHGPAFIFPLGQHQARGGPASQAGPSKSAKASGKVYLSNNSVEGPAVSSLSSPSGTATISFNCSNLPVNEAPSFMAIPQNNGYPFSISTNGGIPPTIKGSEIPFFNASYYSSMFHDSQVQQQQSTSQPQSSCLHLVQLPSQPASTASGSSSFHNGSYNQPQIGSQPSGHCYLSMDGMQQQQSQKQHVAASPSSSKLDKDMSRQDSPIAVDSRESSVKKSSGRKSLAIPVQPMNIALMSRGALYTAGGNQHQYPQQKGSKCGMEVTTPQAFALSFGSTASSNPALNLSSVSRNPAVFQMLPDLAKGGYQLVHAAQVSQHENFRVADGKSVVGAAGNDDGMKGILEKSVAQSLNFSKLSCSNPSNFTVNEIAADGSARVLNVLPSVHSGNQPSGSTSTALNAVLSVDTPNFHPQHQQQELIQFSKQHIQQMQMTGATQVRAPTSTNITHSFSGSNFPNSNSIASHNLVQNIHFVQLSPLKSTSLSTTSPIPSLANTSSLKNSQQQHRNSRHTQISFGSSSNSATAFQGQRIVINSKPASSLVDVSPSNSSLSKNILGSGSLESTSRGRKSRSTMTALPSQQTETSLNGPSQKSSPVCGRNVPQYLAHAPANYLNSSTDDMIY